MESFKRKTAELSEKLTERIRQYQKLQSLYEALKRKFISPTFFEKQANEEKLIEKSRIPFVMSTASGNFSVFKIFNYYSIYNFTISIFIECILVPLNN